MDDNCSLTIREGISLRDDVSWIKEKFPHYT